MALRYIGEMKNRIFENFFLIGSSLTGGAVVAIALASLFGVPHVGDAVVGIGAILGGVLTAAIAGKAETRPAEPAE